MVGSVSTEMKGRPALVRRSRAALVFAICIRENRASCIRAPPEVEKQTRPRPSLMLSSTARTKRAPTTEDMEPPMKENSNEQATTGTPLRVPFITTSASFSPVSFWAADKRSL